MNIQADSALKIIKAFEQ